MSTYSSLGLTSSNAMDITDDGKTIYYANSTDSNKLYKLDVDSGVASLVDDSVSNIHHLKLVWETIF
jgi:sugar lactone lactonase YvrE